MNYVFSTVTNISILIFYKLRPPLQTSCVPLPAPSPYYLLTVPHKNVVFEKPCSHTIHDGCSVDKVYVLCVS